MQREGQLRTQREIQIATITHPISSAEGWNKSRERKKSCSNEHLRPVRNRERDKSGQKRKASERGALTIYRVQSKGQVRTLNASEKAMRVYK